MSSPPFPFSPASSTRLDLYIYAKKFFFLILKNQMGRKHKRKHGGDDEEDRDGEVVRRGTAVMFYADVTKKNILKLMECASEAAKVALNNSNFIDEPRISIFINSDGGDVLTALSAMDQLLRMKIQINTVCDGLCASAATFLLLAGDVRYMTKNSSLLIHQLRASLDGTRSDVNDENLNVNKLDSRMKDVYLFRTTFCEKKLSKLFKHELELDSTQCIKYGIVSKII